MKAWLDVPNIDPALFDPNASSYLYLQGLAQHDDGHEVRIDSLVFTGHVARVKFSLVDVSLEGFSTPTRTSPWILVNLREVAIDRVEISAAGI